MNPAPGLILHTKSASAPRSIQAENGRKYVLDEETGEVREPYDGTLKWQLQAVARLAVGPDHRLRICYRHRRPEVERVEVRQSEKSGRAYFGGLQVCGSVWCCPVCAAKIQAVRALEVRRAIDQATENGWTVLLLTQTVRHSRADVLGDLLDGFNLGMRKFKGQRAYTRAVEAFGIVGTIRGLEVTWNEANGWHPHAHTLVFLDRALQPEQVEQLRAALFRCWASAVDRAGLGTVSEQAFSLQDGAAVRTYVTKLGTEYQWSAEHELVKSHTKSGRASSFTPFDLLRAYLEQPDDGRWLALFAEFAFTFHGKRQLVWSNGLKQQLLGTEGLTDEQVAESIGEADPVLAEIEVEDWRRIRRRNLQATVLQVAERHGGDGVRTMLEALRNEV